MTRLRRLLARRWAVDAQWPHETAPELPGRFWSQAGAERRTAHLTVKELP